MKKILSLLSLSLLTVVFMSIWLKAMPAPEASQESKWLNNNATPEQKEIIAKLRKADAIANNKGYSVSVILADTPEKKMLDSFPIGIQMYLMSKLPHTFFEGSQGTPQHREYTGRNEIKDVTVTPEDIKNFATDNYRYVPNSINMPQESKWLQNNATPEQKAMIAKLIKADAIAHDKGYSLSLISEDSPEIKMLTSFPSGVQHYIALKLPHTQLGGMWWLGNRKSNEYTSLDLIKTVTVNPDDIKNSINNLSRNSQ